MAELTFLIEGEPVDISATANGNSYDIKIDERIFTVQPLGDNLFEITCNDQRVIAAAVSNNGAWFLDLESYQLELREPSEDAIASGGGDQTGEKDKVYAPMPGKIVKLLVSEGETVEKKQPLVIVEAMKMENQVLALAAGSVKAINCAAGDQVDTETPLIELELDDDA